jgi:peptidoglycan/LPS O-acetylase OafA/YrhL
MEARPQDLGTKHIAFLDGLRGVLAVYVLCHHFLAWNMPSDLARPLRAVGLLFTFGHAAVCAFIVLSGFSLMLPVVPTGEGRVRGGFWGYLRRRALRILPAYYAALALSIGVVVFVSIINPTVVRELSIKSILSHLLLVHTLIPGQHDTINMALWSVATEWHIYFLFPLVLLPVWRWFGSGAVMLTAFALGVIPQLVLPSGSPVHQACPWFLGLFATGMVAAEVVTAERAGPRRVIGHVILGTICAVVYVGLKYMRPGPEFGAGPTGIQWLKDGMCGLVFACLLVDLTSRSLSASTGLTRRNNRLLSLLTSWPARQFGLFSYSLYATHCATLELMNGLTAYAGLGSSTSFLLRACVGLPLAIGVAYLVSLGFERPFLSARARRPSPGPLVLESALP